MEPLQTDTTLNPTLVFSTHPSPTSSANRTPLAWAKFYASLGWHVFPIYEITNHKCSCGRSCESPGKHPRTSNGWKDATVDDATIEAWWSQWPAANIGIATGSASGLVVVDEDPRNGAPESKERLEARIVAAKALLGV